MKRKGIFALCAASIATLGSMPASQAEGISGTNVDHRVLAAAPTMTQDTYLATIRALLAGEPGDSQSDATLVEGGKSICADIEGGATAETFEEQIDAYGLNRAVYRVVIRSSILTFCPKYSSVIR